MSDINRSAPVSVTGDIAVGNGIKPLLEVRANPGGALCGALWRIPEAVGLPVTPDSLNDLGALSYLIAGTPFLSRLTNGREELKRLRTGAVIFHPPGQRSDTWRCHSPFEFFQIYLPRDSICDFANEDRRECAAPVVPYIFAVEDPWLRGYFRWLLSEYEPFYGQSVAADDLLLIISHTRHLLIRHLIRHYSGARTSELYALDKRAKVNPLPGFLLKRTVEFVDAHLSGDLSLHALARLASMSPDHFLRSFRAATGTTPCQYVLEQRLRKAGDILATSNMPVHEVAATCGFGTLKYLSARFHIRLGVSPSKYRKSQARSVDTARHSSR